MISSLVHWIKLNCIFVVLLAWISILDEHIHELAVGLFFNTEPMKIPNRIRPMNNGNQDRNVNPTDELLN